jgi:hypothetical protein
MKSRRVNIRGRDIRVMHVRKMPKGDETHLGHYDLATETIRIRDNLVGLERLIVEVHEAIHAAYYDLDEQAVEDGGRDIAALLWALGYRRVPDAELPE